MEYEGMEGAVRAVQDTAREAESNKLAIEVGTIDGIHYTRQDLKFLSKPDPRPAKAELTTLQGIADFVTDDADKAFTEGRTRFLLIESPTRVALYTGAQGPAYARHAIAQADAVVPDLSLCVRPMKDLAPNVSWTDPETFVIAARALFVNDEPLNKLIALLGAIKWEQQQSVSDDGFTMVYATRSGIVIGDTTTGERTLAKNPWRLCAFRSFSEIDQAPADFILRTRGGATSKQVALFEVGDGLWRKVAIRSIKAFLEAEGVLPDSVAVYG